jgi:protein TonB
MLNLSGRESTAPSPAPFGLSAALHLLAGPILIYAMQADASSPTTRIRPTNTTLVYVAAIPVEMPAIALPALPAPAAVTAPEPAPPVPMPEVAPVFESRRVEIAKAVELPVEPAPAAPVSRRPEVTVGAFTNAPAPVRPAEPAHQVEVVAFDRGTQPTVAAKPATASVGAFDRPVTDNAPPRISPETVVADAAFNRPAARNATVPEGRVTRETGFGNTNSSEKPRVAEPPMQIAQVTFNTARARQPVSRSELPSPQPRVTPVEVLFKPTPAYTEEARKRQIEGDVLLDVEFLSNGGVRVLRVLRGLGYGLDEAATRAAEQIRFKPAQDSGRSVDSRVTVNIVFRLA